MKPSRDRGWLSQNPWSKKRGEGYKSIVVQGKIHTPKERGGKIGLKKK